VVRPSSYCRAIVIVECPAKLHAAMNCGCKRCVVGARREQTLVADPLHSEPGRHALNSRGTARRIPLRHPQDQRSDLVGNPGSYWRATMHILFLRLADGLLPLADQASSGTDDYGSGRKRRGDHTEPVYRSTVPWRDHPSVGRVLRIDSFYLLPEGCCCLM